LALKGTKKRPQRQLEVDIENLGGHLSAYSSRDKTVFYAKVFKNDVPQAIEILSDVLQNSLLDENAINREKDVIVRELELANSQGEHQIMDHLHETAYQGNGLGLTVHGTADSVKSITRNDLQSFISTHFTADRIVISGAGAVDHKQLVELTQKHFGGLQSGSKDDKSSIDRAVFTGSDKRIRFDSLQKAHVAVAFQAASWTSEYAFPLMVMQTLLGSWERSSHLGRNAASRLAQDLSHNNTVHSFKTFNKSYKDTGLFGVYLVASDNKLDDSMYYTLSNLVRLCHQVTDEEVERAKTQLKATMLNNFESSFHVCEDIGNQMLNYNRRMSRAETFARIDAISTDNIKATANQFINDEDHALAAVGPIFELPDYNWIRRRSYWQRY